jgi:hypothetical protein
MSLVLFLGNTLPARDNGPRRIVSVTDDSFFAIEAADALSKRFQCRFVLQTQASAPYTKVVLPTTIRQAKKLHL